jgi:hypothetical protein
MNNHYQIEITVYSKQHGCKRERQKNIKWLETIIPVVMKAQTSVTEIIFFKESSQVTSFCLN